MCDCLRSFIAVILRSGLYSHNATPDRGEPKKKSCRRSGDGARYVAYRAAHSAFTAPLRSFTESFGKIVVSYFPLCNSDE